MQAFARLDTQTGALQIWQPGPSSVCGEMVFAPTAASGEREDEGFLLGIVFDSDTRRTSLMVRGLVALLTHHHLWLHPIRRFPLLDALIIFYLMVLFGATL